eukprot:CAMPEP_0202899906 /NCGR_PEP_ID=MMETSP1392-20130828/9292_1 /ASSEMBLY_ACC=CAM_ASM_000868 /TAXON_ID=225041 /ORGANISM="Chlamydomonas chlamydogama, Strain SAG 11-48b" /LENGTH=96 /DNA_ID=CAMNT_0049586203 /DNA_START=282 /DNA_END=572 /DNA_ORIENTATION=+
MMWNCSQPGPNGVMSQPENYIASNAGPTTLSGKPRFNLRINIPDGTVTDATAIEGENGLRFSPPAQLLWSGYAPGYAPGQTAVPTGHGYPQQHPWQ